MNYRVISVFTLALLLSLGFAAVAHATSCDFGSDIGGGQCKGFIYSSSWTVPMDWNNHTNLVECVGSGGDGGNGENVGVGAGGGGGGAYASAAISGLTRGSSPSIHVAAGGENAATYLTGSLSCDYGQDGGVVDGNAGGTGGQASNSTGSTKYSGGNGGAGDTGGEWDAGGGGGAAASNAGAGAGGGSASAWTGGNGGNWDFASHDGEGGSFGFHGNAGFADYSESSGGGGGGGGAPNSPDSSPPYGGDGGTYGGGGGGSGDSTDDDAGFGYGGSGQAGLIIVTYTPPPPITGVSCSVSPGSGSPGTTFTWTASASGGDGGAYTYSWSAPSLSGSSSTYQLSGTYSSPGTYSASVTVTDSSGDSSGSVGCSGSATVNKYTQATLNFSGQTVTYPSGFSGLSTSGGSGTGAVSYAVTSPGAGCSISGTTLSYTSAGTCGVTATKAADTNYYAISSSQATFTINKATQATLTANSQTVTYPSTFSAPTASGGSGSGAVTYAVTTAGSAGCSWNGSTFSYTSAGTCGVTAYKAADTNYNSAQSSEVTYTVNKGTQATLNFSGQTVTYPTTFTVPLSTTGGSGSGAVTYAVTTAGTAGCSVASNGSTLTYTNAGTCGITAYKAADTNYNSAQSSEATFTINKESQTITFNSLSNKVNGDAPFSVSATASSGLTVSFNSQTTGVCTSTGTNGTTITILTAGTCTIQATQSGNSNYAAATSVNRSFTVYAHLSVGACSASPLYSNPSITVTWSAAGLTGGMGPTPSYTYLWTLSGGANETTQGSLTAATVGASYSATSTYTGSLTITDANDSADTATCSPTGSVTIYPLITGGTCSVTPSSGPPSTAFTWNMPSIIGGDNGPYTYTWHGTNLTGNSGSSSSLALSANTYINGTYLNNYVVVTDTHLDSTQFSCPNLMVSAALPVGQVQFFGGKTSINGGHIYIR